MERLVPHIPEHRKGLVYIVIAALLWSSSGLFIKVLTLTAFQISFFRSLVAALTIVAVLRFRGGNRSSTCAGPMPPAPSATR